MNDTPKRRSRLQQDAPAERSARTHRRSQSREDVPAERTGSRTRSSRSRKKNGKVLYYLVLAILLGVLVFSAVKIISYLKEQKDTENAQNNMNNEFVEPVTPTTPDDTDGDTSADDKDKTQAVSQPEHKGKIDFAAMKEKYPDVVGWIYGANTGLDWPIVQTAEENGEYYLYRDIDGKDNKNGTVFLDHGCAYDFTSQNNLIYGHNMKTGLMFAPLMKYKSQSFYDTHSYLYLYTPSQTYKVNLFAGMVTPHDSEVYSYSLSSSYLQECISNSTFRSSMGTPTGNILTLSTCDYDFDNARYVLMGELEAIDDPW